MTWCRNADKIICISYDPYKSNVFSLELCLLSVFGVDVHFLNYFGVAYDIHIIRMLTISYDYVAKDSLKKISYKLLRDELQNTINEKIKEFPYCFLSETLRKMLETDMLGRATIRKIYKDAKFFMGIID